MRYSKINGTLESALTSSVTRVNGVYVPNDRYLAWTPSVKSSCTIKDDITVARIMVATQDGKMLPKLVVFQFSRKNRIDCVLRHVESAVNANNGWDIMPRHNWILQNRCLGAWQITT